MQPLRVHYLQTDLHWEDFQANRTHLEPKLSTLRGHSDLILLPEMFGSGFTMQPEQVAQEMSGEAVSWMQDMAKELDAAIMGSLVIKEDQNYFNRLICAESDGSVSFYDKRHLFSYGGEDKSYTPGRHHLILTIKGWRILGLICYDLRFPVWSRNVWNYDLLVYVANWPVTRIDAWQTLLKARAIENQSYVVGVNRVGSDPLDINYPGMSAVYDMAGNLLHESGSGEEIGAVTLQYDTLHDYRNHFSFLHDMDRFQIG
ncbi:MAG TPA: amidohydrolase [Saprospiraceae bacterium]|nr:amidohydrolase [Saprospiraceae bacterium]